MGVDSNWVSILEYARIKKISISTIRRHIKAGRIKSKQLKGKYFLLLPASLRSIDDCETKESRSADLDNNQRYLLQKQENRELREEIADLRMLVQLLESRSSELMVTPSSSDTPPVIPTTLS
ncbi:MAG: hypothetical protein HN353_02335 [Bdellovibrionales bacterium]|jgi:hypothetical protein|nr:hypothetical protein [Bdellovibrionales bacterium]MBT3525524.1 hypothetical protein [Bdellovibrionales bacterium]MBT7668212.1 hypothetical protein [Bdellovibrionales bacterium]MBT7766046.1 hypothetical protein [Bdellovibrionales bacterium]